MTERIRGRQLQEIREEHFRLRPLCVRCKPKGIVAIATQLDHIVALVNGGIDSLDPFENRQGLCDACHFVKTDEDLGRVTRPTIGANGYPC